VRINLSKRFLKMKKGLLFLILCFLFTASMAQADSNLLVNPGFEATWEGYLPSDPPRLRYMYSPTGLGMGWTFTGAYNGVSKTGTDWSGEAWRGDQFAFIQGGDGDIFASGISQVFTLTSMSDLSLSFYMMLRPTYWSGQQVVVGLDSEVYTFSPGASWTEVSLYFPDVAKGMHTLRFGGTGNNCGVGEFSDTSAFLDNVDLTATATPAPVPEPTTILLLGLGLIGVAGARIRFSRKS
jgi:hypothetical protein